MSDANDISKLIKQADEQVRHHDQRTSTSKRKSLPGAAIWNGVLLAVIVYAGVTVSDALSPPSEERVAHDLEQLIEHARQMVDDIQKDTGKLPDAIPNAALASAVQYEKRSTDYKLTATVLGVRVTLEGSGKPITETGVK